MTSPTSKQLKDFMNVSYNTGDRTFGDLYDSDQDLAFQAAVQGSSYLEDLTSKLHMFTKRAHPPFHPFKHSDGDTPEKRDHYIKLVKEVFKFIIEIRTPVVHKLMYEVLNMLTRKHMSIMAALYTFLTEPKTKVGSVFKDCKLEMWTSFELSRLLYSVRKNQRMKVEVAAFVKYMLSRIAMHYMERYNCQSKRSRMKTIEEAEETGTSTI